MSDCLLQPDDNMVLLVDKPIADMKKEVNKKLSGMTYIVCGHSGAQAWISHLRWNCGE